MYFKYKPSSGLQFPMIQTLFIGRYQTFLSVQSPTEAGECTFLKHFLNMPERFIARIDAERLAFTAGSKAVLEDERTCLDALRTNIRTHYPWCLSRIFTDDKYKNKMAADDEHITLTRDPGRARPRKIIKFRN